MKKIKDQLFIYLFITIYSIVLKRKLVNYND